MEFRTTNIVWEEDWGVATVGEFVIELKRSNNKLIEAKVKEVLSYTKSHTEIPYVANIEDRYITVDMGFCGIKKYELVNDALIELY
ncbi:hypothetical protein JCM14036_12110 [Desulfotomaculum defluvii]